MVEEGKPVKRVHSVSIVGSQLNELRRVRKK